MLFDVQRLVAGGALVDVRPHDPKQDRKGDAKPPFKITVSEMTATEAAELRVKALAGGGDGFAERNPYGGIPDADIRAEFIRRGLTVAVAEMER